MMIFEDDRHILSLNIKDDQESAAAAVVERRLRQHDTTVHPF